MQAPPAASPHTTGVYSVLTGAGFAVGRGQSPPSAGWQGEPGQSTFVRYAILWPWPGTPHGYLSEANTNLTYTCQVTLVGATQQQAEAALDDARAALIGQRIPVTGRVSQPAWAPVERGAEREDDVAVPEHYAILQVRFRTSPA